MEGKTIVYKSYDNISEALYVQNVLKEAGIRSFISEDSVWPFLSTLSTNIWGYKLNVFEGDIDKIEEILKNLYK